MIIKCFSLFQFCRIHHVHQIIDVSSQVKNATYLCEVIEEVIAEVGEEHVMQVVTDNAASYVAAGKLLSLTT